MSCRTTARRVSLREAACRAKLHSTTPIPPQQVGDNDGYRILFWKLKKTDRYFALLTTRDPVAGQDGRLLAGYYELRDSSAPLPADVLARIQRWA